jgi:hypothetical protein
MDPRRLLIPNFIKIGSVVCKVKDVECYLDHFKERRISSQLLRHASRFTEHFWSNKTAIKLSNDFVYFSAGLGSILYFEEWRLLECYAVWLL